MPAPSSPQSALQQVAERGIHSTHLTSSGIIQRLASARKALPGIRHRLRVEYPLRILCTSIRGHGALTLSPSRRHILKPRRQRDRPRRGARFED